MAGNNDKQKRKVYFDELLLILFDAVETFLAIGFFFPQISRFFCFDLQVFSLLGLRGLCKVSVSH